MAGTAMRAQRAKANVRSGITHYKTERQVVFMDNQPDFFRSGDEIHSQRLAESRH